MLNRLKVCVRSDRRIATTLLALSTALASCSDDTLKPSDISAAYQLVSVASMPLPAVIDQQAGIVVVRSGFFLARDYTYIASATAEITRDGVVAETTTESTGTYRLHKDAVTLVDTDGNEATLTFDASHWQVSGPGLPNSGLGTAILRVHVYDRQPECCFPEFP